MIKLLRKPEVLDLLGIKKSTLSCRVHEGIFPPPISLGNRAIAWASNEVDLVIKAMIMGKSNDDMKAIVSRIVEQRKDFDRPVNKFL